MAGRDDSFVRQTLASACCFATHPSVSRDEADACFRHPGGPDRALDINGEQKFDCVVVALLLSVGEPRACLQRGAQVRPVIGLSGSEMGWRSIHDEPRA
jgi:hypothetical protein